MIAACPFCAGKARWYMTSYADGIGRPTDYYRCLQCGKMFAVDTSSLQ